MGMKDSPLAEITAYAGIAARSGSFNLTAVFREDDHVGDASTLFAVCESPQPGILVHPTRGTHLVACRQITVRLNSEILQVGLTAGFGLNGS